MPWPKTGETQYHAQLGLPFKGCVIKGLVVCNNWNLESLDLLNGLALGCYQPTLRYYSYYVIQSISSSLDVFLSLLLNNFKVASI